MCHAVAFGADHTPSRPRLLTGLACSRKWTTDDGFEICYQVNMLSHYALIVPLFQLDFLARDARVVLLSSSGMYASKKLDPEDLNSDDILGSYKEGETTNFEKLWSLSGRSKAGQVVFVRELQARLAGSRRWRDVSVSACHPGELTRSNTRQINSPSVTLF